MLLAIHLYVLPHMIFFCCPADTTEDEMVRWHHQLSGHGFGWTLDVGDGQGGLACCRSWGR